MPFLTDYTGTPYDYKDPLAVLDYVVDWTAWLAERSDTIQSVTFTATGATINRWSFSGGLASVWVSGGTLNTIANIRCQIVTVNGRTAERSFNLRIQAQ